jgi:hypothetical protein
MIALLLMLFRWLGAQFMSRLGDELVDAVVDDGVKMRIEKPRS